MNNSQCIFMNTSILLKFPANGNSIQIKTFQSRLADSLVNLFHFPFSTSTAQNKKFSIKDFFSKCGQMRSSPCIWSHILNKSFLENFLCSSPSFAKDKLIPFFITLEPWIWFLTKEINVSNYFIFRVFLWVMSFMERRLKCWCSL